jgi:8-oxo-dGTP pyrophosphatase MutT (NUDIX family)
VGALALIERDEELLLERRSDSGQWGLIGGSIEVSESIGEALRREVMEETGLTVRGHELFGVFSNPKRIAHYPDGNIVRVIAFVFRVEVEGFDALRMSEESLEMRFFGRDELRNLDVVETMRPIIERYLSPEPGGPLVE